MHSFSFPQVADQLLLFLLKHYGLTLKQIGLDFIRDYNGVEWLIGCKAFKTVPRGSDQNKTLLDKFGKAFMTDILSQTNNKEARKKYF